MTAWIVRLVAQGGSWGVFLLMLVENVVPPIPSELIMPLAGFACARGEMSWMAVVVAGTAGSVVGAWGWYEFGRRLGLERLARWIDAHGRWLAVTPKEFARVDGWFQRFGPWILVIGRCLPGVRGVICIPAGVTGMNRLTFAAACTAGSGLWCIFLVEAGRSLGAHYAQVDTWTAPVSTTFFAGCVLAYAVRVILYRRVADADRAL